MAKRRIKQRRRKSKRKIKANSAHASLSALAPLITGRQIFDHIHQTVKIKQKRVDYRPSDKLVFVVIGIMSGCEAVFDLNRKLRVDRLLLRAFGYQKCADQSVIQDTLNAATEHNVQQLEAALKAIWDRCFIVRNLGQTLISFLFVTDEEQFSITVALSFVEWVALIQAAKQLYLCLQKRYNSGRIFCSFGRWEKCPRGIYVAQTIQRATELS
jgi:hypothetical protein